MAARPSRCSRCGTRPATCATSSRRRASRPRREEKTMKRTLLIAIAALSTSAALVAVHAKPFTYAVPEDKSAFKPGPNLEVVQGNCGSCHSADYIITQPQGAAFKKAFWEAEVAKMINVYGAPIDPADVPKIVEYLVQVY